MKNIKFLFYALSFLLIFSSCKSDDDDDDSTTDINNIVGNWKIVDAHGTTEYTTIVSGQNFIINFVYEGNNYNSFVEITENPNEYSSTGSFTNHIVTTTQGQTTEEDQEIDTVENGTWEIEGDQFIRTEQGQTESDSHTILELTATTFKTRTNISREETINGTTGISVIEVFQTYEKQ